MLYSGKFQNNSPFSSGERPDFIEFQDSKLTKIEYFHKRDAADVTVFLKEVNEIGYYLRHLSNKQKKT